MVEVTYMKLALLKVADPQLLISEMARLMTFSYSLLR